MNAQERKQRPLYSGCLMYFPDALLEVAHCSFVGNEQHNPGQPLHWDRSKSTDEKDACVRHLIESGTRDTDGVRHAAKAAWRALANLQKEIEAEREPKLDDLCRRLLNASTPFDARAGATLHTCKVCGPECKC